jgi:hypothetical protein
VGFWFLPLWFLGLDKEKVVGVEKDGKKAERPLSHSFHAPSFQSTQDTNVPYFGVSGSESQLLY